MLAQSDNRGIIYSFAIPATNNDAPTAAPAAPPAAAPQEKTLREADYSRAEISADDRYRSYIERLRQREAERRARRLQQERQYGRAVDGNTTYSRLLSEQRPRHSHNNRGLNLASGQPRNNHNSHRHQQQQQQRYNQPFNQPRVVQRNQANGYSQSQYSYTAGR